MRPWLIRTALLFLGLFFLSNAGLAQRPGNGPTRKSLPENAPGPLTIQIHNRPGPGSKAEPIKSPRFLDTRSLPKDQHRGEAIDVETLRRASDRLLDDMDSIRQARAVTPARQLALRDDLRALLGDPRAPGQHPVDSMANDLAWAIADGGITRASAGRLAESLAVLGDPAPSRAEHLRAVDSARAALMHAGVSDRDQKAMAIHFHEVSARALANRPLKMPR